MKNIVVALILGVLVLSWILVGVCTVAEGIHVVLVYVGISCKTLVYSFSVLTLLVILSDLVIRLTQWMSQKEE